LVKFNHKSARYWYEDLLNKFIFEDYLYQFKNKKKHLITEIVKIKNFLNINTPEKESDYSKTNLELLDDEFKLLLKKKLYETNDYNTQKEIYLEIIDNKPDSEDPFILGTKNFVDNHTSCEISYCSKINSKLRFPFAQSSFDGYIYLKDLTYKLSHFPNSSRKSPQYHFCPAPLEKFPIRKWKLQKRIIKPSVNSDVFYCENPFDQTTHNLIKYYLDKLSLVTKDYHNENYQNIIDPNMCVMQESQQSKMFLWAATEFLLTEKNQYTDKIALSMK